VKDRGLPFHKQSFKFGNLFILFKVSFPLSVTNPQLKQLGIALGDMKQLQIDEQMEANEVVMLTNYSES
jgi:hypothetical protein